MFQWCIECHPVHLCPAWNVACPFVWQIPESVQVVCESPTSHPGNKMDCHWIMVLVLGVPSSGRLIPQYATGCAKEKQLSAISRSKRRKTNSRLRLLRSTAGITLYMNLCRRRRHMSCFPCCSQNEESHGHHAGQVLMGTEKAFDLRMCVGDAVHFGSVSFNVFNVLGHIPLRARGDYCTRGGYLTLPKVEVGQSCLFMD